jgi:hypothetical protein
VPACQWVLCHTRLVWLITVTHGAFPPHTPGTGGGGLFKKKKKPLKNPEAETSFLPDPEREREEQELREKLKQEWLAEQERIKGACPWASPAGCSVLGLTDD